MRAAQNRKVVLLATILCLSAGVDMNRLLADVFTKEKFKPLLSEWERDGFRTLSDLRSIEKMISYVFSKRIYTWQETVKIVSEINEALRSATPEVGAAVRRTVPLTREQKRLQTNRQKQIDESTRYRVLVNKVAAETASSMQDAFVQVCEIMIACSPKTMIAFTGKPIPSAKAVIFSKSANKKLKCSKLSNGTWVCLFRNEKNSIAAIRDIILACGVMAGDICLTKYQEGVGWSVIPIDLPHGDVARVRLPLTIPAEASIASIRERNRKGSPKATAQSARSTNASSTPIAPTHSINISPSQPLTEGVSSAPTAPAESQLSDPTQTTPRVYVRDDKEAFYEWLRDVHHMADATCRGYVSAIRSAERFAEEYALSSRRIYTPDKDEARETVAVLLANPRFIRENTQQHNRFSAAFSKYLQFIGEKASVPYNTYRKESTTPAAQTEPEVPATRPADDGIIQFVSKVLTEQFSNGFKLNSPVYIGRFRRHVTENYDQEFTLSDDELISCIKACGTYHNGKVYSVASQTKERISELAKEHFDSGAQAIFFDEFFSQNESWLFESNVVSPDILAEIFRGLFPRLWHKSTHFGRSNGRIPDIIEEEVLRVWCDGSVLMTCEQLYERLRYTPLSRIKTALAQNDSFIWSNLETYTHVSLIRITNEEILAVRKAAAQACDTDGYISVTDLPFGEIFERNDELSIPAVHTAIFRLCLSDKYDKQGKIITRIGDDLDLMAIMKDYCSSVDKCSLDDLIRYERELTGEVHRWAPMEAAYATLVRLNKETFAAERYVRFDVDLIDAAISEFVTGDYLTLKSFTTFGVFPDCGQTWNLFLLESYCRRFSREFGFAVPAVNSRNAGVVVRKSCSMDYTEIMADAVAKSDVQLTDKAVGDYLYAKGYTGKSTTSKISAIISIARAIRERGH